MTLHFCCFKPSSLWHLVTAVLGNWVHQNPEQHGTCLWWYRDHYLISVFILKILFWIIWFTLTYECINCYKKRFLYYGKGKQQYLLSILNNYSVWGNTILNPRNCLNLLFSAKQSLWSKPFLNICCLDVNRPIMLYNSPKICGWSSFKLYFQIFGLYENKYAYLPCATFWLQCHLHSLHS